jgi:hypothetical protein
LARQNKTAKSGAATPLFFADFASARDSFRRAGFFNQILRSLAARLTPPAKSAKIDASYQRRRKDEPD